MNGFLWLLVRRESARTATDQSDCSNGFDAWYAVAIIVQTLVRCAMLHRSNQLTCTTTLRQSCQQTNKHIMHRLIPPKSALLQNHSRVVIAYADVNIIIIRTPSHPSSSLSLAIYHHGQQHQERYITLPAQEVFAKAQPQKTVRALMTLQWSSSMDAIIISLYCKYECWFVCEKSVIEFKFSPTGYTLRFVIMQTVVPPPPPPPTFCSPKSFCNQPTKHCTEGVMNNAVAAEHYVLQMC